MSAVAVKVGLGCVAAVAIFEAITAQVVMNALVLFVAAGIIPGTDIVLSPDATIVTVVVLLLGVILLLNRKRIMLGLRDPHMELKPAPEPVHYRVPAPVPAVHMSEFTLPRPIRPGRARALLYAARQGIHTAMRTLGDWVGALGWLAVSASLVARQRFGSLHVLLRHRLPVWSKVLHRVQTSTGTFWRTRKLNFTIWKIKAQTKAETFMERLLSE